MPDIGDEDTSLPDLLRGLVREGMERKGMSQYQLAKVTGISEKHVSRLLNGKTAGSMFVWDKLLKSVSEGNGEAR